MDKVYHALYCPCTHESGFVTLSLHRTEQGAELAVEAHQRKSKEDWNGNIPKWVKWDIQSMEVLE
jgi:hypothetical protein